MLLVSDRSQREMTANVWLRCVRSRKRRGDKKRFVYIGSEPKIAERGERGTSSNRNIASWRVKIYTVVCVVPFVCIGNPLPDRRVREKYFFLPGGASTAALDKTREVACDPL
ncbi:hypothetical protein MTO96_030501 [Rhipicephalus appendiculatus]